MLRLKIVFQLIFFPELYFWRTVNQPNFGPDLQAKLFLKLIQKNFCHFWNFIIQPHRTVNITLILCVETHKVEKHEGSNNLVSDNQQAGHKLFFLN